MRALIYARFSSDLQQDRSIDDQVNACRDFAAKQGWEVVDVFTDYAISGAAGLGGDQRPGINALLDRIKAGGITAVLADTSSRVARDLGDSHVIRKMLAYHGAKLFTLADGEIDFLKGTIKGLFDEQQRSDIAHNIRRGQRGRALARANPGGMAYGYRKIPKLDERGEAIRGLREIHQDQAEVILRIFREFSCGDSARTICGRLNSEGIPSPSGRKWRMTSILGDAQRLNGILRNDLYRGRLIYNRTRRVYHPMTRRREIRVNPESEWLTVEAPELRIVPDELWDDAQRMIRRYSGGLTSKIRRPKRLLSGKAVCGVCGGGWSIVAGSNRFGGRWGCSAHQDGRGCTNGRTITNDSFQKRVLRGLSERLLDPEFVRIYVEEWRAARSERIAAARKDRSRLEKRKTDADRRVQRLVTAIADGLSDVAEIKGALRDAKAESDAATAALKDIEADNVVALHPGLAEDYQRRISHLVAAVDGGITAEAREAVRALIDRIVVMPREGKIGTEIEVHGVLSNIITLAGGKVPECAATLVPLEGHVRDRTLLKIAV